jgi:hypothetical protein
VRRVAPILVVLAVLAGAVVVLLRPGGGSIASGASPGQEDPELIGGYGSLGSGASGASSAHGGPSAEMPGLDAGVIVDGGEGAPVPLGPSEPVARRPDPPPDLPASITFPVPRTIEDEYDSANMIWSLIEARRADVRAELAEARRTGDQQLSARLAHQLELLELGDRRLAGIVRDLDTQRAATTPPEEAGADDDHDEGAPPR